MLEQGVSGAVRSGQGKMRRIVVSLLKGGVAKSETAVSLAHGMAMMGLKVLLVDTDVQAQCNDMLGVDPPRGLADVIAGWCHPHEALLKARDNLFLLAGGNELAAVKMEIARREMAPEAVLDEALSNYQDEFDVMVMDTAPGWDTLLVNALYASREVLSPVSMEPVALTGLVRFEERLQIIQKYNPRLMLRWVVPTFVDGRVKKTGEILEQLKARFGDRVAPSIKYSVRLSEAPAFGKTIYEHEPKGVAAQCYLRLTQRVVDDGPPALTLAVLREASRPQPVPPAMRAQPAPAAALPPEKVITLSAQPPAAPEPAAAPEPTAVPEPLAPPAHPEPMPPAAEGQPASPLGRVCFGLRARLEQAQTGLAPEPCSGGEPAPGSRLACLAPPGDGAGLRLKDKAIEELRRKWGKHAGT